MDKLPLNKNKRLYKSDSSKTIKGNQSKNKTVCKCELQKLFDEINKQACNKSIVKVEHDEKYRKKEEEKEDFHKANNEFYYNANLSKSSYWKYDNSYLRKDKCRQDFYRISTQDDSFESNSVKVQVDFDSIISGINYRHNDYREKYQEYIYFNVKSRKIYANNNFHQIIFDYTENSENNEFSNYDQEFSSHEKNFSRNNEQTDKKEFQTFSDNENIQTYLSTQINSKVKQQYVTETKSEVEINSETNKKFFSFEQEICKEEEIYSRKQIKKIQNLGKSYVEKTIDEETLKITKFSCSTKIQLYALMINGLTKNCFSADRAADSAEIFKKCTSSKFLCNTYDIVVYTCESVYKMINVNIKEMTHA